MGLFYSRCRNRCWGTELEPDSMKLGDEIGLPNPRKDADEIYSPPKPHALDCRKLWVQGG